MTDAELRSLERLCSKDDLSDSNVATLTVLGLAAAHEIRSLRARSLSTEERQALEWVEEWIELHRPSAASPNAPKMCSALSALARLLGEDGTP